MGNKVRIRNTHCISNMYKGYIDWIKEKELYVPSSRDFSKIIQEFNLKARDKVLEGEVFVMPAGMGVMRIIKSKTNAVRYSNPNAVDWPATKAAGKWVFHTNYHSDGYTYRIQWVYHDKVRHSRKYYFVPARNFKRTLAKVIKSRTMDYFQSR